MKIVKFLIYLNERWNLKENKDEEILNNTINEFTLTGKNLFSDLTKVHKLERFLQSFQDKTDIIKKWTNINKVLKLDFSGNEIEKQGNKLFIVKNKEKIYYYI